MLYLNTLVDILIPGQSSKYYHVGAGDLVRVTSVAHPKHGLTGVIQSKLLFDYVILDHVKINQSK